MDYINLSLFINDLIEEIEYSKLKLNLIRKI